MAKSFHDVASMGQAAPYVHPDERFCAVVRKVARGEMTVDDAWRLILRQREEAALAEGLARG